MVDHPGLEELTITVGWRAVDILDEHEVGILPDVPGPSENGNAIGVGEGSDGVYQRSIHCVGAVLIAGLSSDDRDALPLFQVPSKSKKRRLRFRE